MHGICGGSNGDILLSILSTAVNATWSASIGGDT